MVHVSLTKMCILLLLDEVVYRYALYPVGGIVELNYVLTDFMPVAHVHFDRGVLKSTVITVNSSTSCSSIIFGFT